MVMAPIFEKSAGPLGPTVVISEKGKEAQDWGSTVGCAIQPLIGIDGVYARLRTITPSLQRLAEV